MTAVDRLGFDLRLKTADGIKEPASTSCAKSRTRMRLARCSWKRFEVLSPKPDEGRSRFIPTSVVMLPGDPRLKYRLTTYAD